MPLKTIRMQASDRLWITPRINSMAREKQKKTFVQGHQIRYQQRVMKIVHLIINPSGNNEQISRSSPL